MRELTSIELEAVSGGAALITVALPGVAGVAIAAHVPVLPPVMTADATPATSLG